MSTGWIEAGLRQVGRSFRRILSADADHIIQEAIAELRSSKKQYDARIGRTDDPRLKVAPWGYQIRPERPLGFRPTKCDGITLFVDLYCTVLWEDATMPPVRQNTYLRVWTDESGCMYREQWDSEHVLAKLTAPDRSANGRVMLRCHFDLADAQQSGPKHHLQFGGKAQADELCWHLPEIALPRLAYPPMDLILACQLVAANFHWEEYAQLRDRPEWRSALLASQRHLILGYYQDCARVLGDQKALLDHLWNT